VAGIFNAESSFTYSYWDTPYITSMTHNLWDGATGQFIGYMYTDALSKISVTFNSYNAFLGSNENLNPDNLAFTSTDSDLYYYTPLDIPAGFYNSTITLSNIDSQSYNLATGYTNFFPNKETDSQFLASLGGISYLVAIYPVIQSISPSHGSLAGGTTITITGSGFNNDTTTLRVVVGGVDCKVQSASVTTIICLTGAIDTSESIIATIASDPKTEPYLYANKSHGSPGEIFSTRYSLQDIL